MHDFTQYKCMIYHPALGLIFAIHLWHSPVYQSDYSCVGSCDQLDTAWKRRRDRRTVSRASPPPKQTNIFRFSCKNRRTRIVSRERWRELGVRVRHGTNQAYGVSEIVVVSRAVWVVCYRFTSNGETERASGKVATNQSRFVPVQLPVKCK